MIIIVAVTQTVTRCLLFAISKSCSAANNAFLRNGYICSKLRNIREYATPSKNNRPTLISFMIIGNQTVGITLNPP